MERECLQSHNIHLVIHYDPVVTDDPEMNRLLQSVKTILSSIDPYLKPHDFRMVSGGGHTNLIFDVSLPARLSGEKKAIQRQLEDTLSQQEGTRIYTVITFDPAAFNTEE
jgi:divalent metal cation (Fe/Co/Zn/Cd) transporter